MDFLSNWMARIQQCPLGSYQRETKANIKEFPKLDNLASKKMAIALDRRHTYSLLRSMCSK